VCRDLAAKGHSVIGVDVSATLLRLARAADPEGCYGSADAAALPFIGKAFDLVVAYNSLMDVDDMPGTVHEAARVLRHFKGWGYSLEDYFIAFESAGLSVEALREPAVPEVTVAKHPK